MSLNSSRRFVPSPWYLPSPPTKKIRLSFHLGENNCTNAFDRIGNSTPSDRYPFSLSGNETCSSRIYLSNANFDYVSSVFSKRYIYPLLLGKRVLSFNAIHFYRVTREDHQPRNRGHEIGESRLQELPSRCTDKRVYICSNRKNY